MVVPNDDERTDARMRDDATVDEPSRNDPTDPGSSGSAQRNRWSDRATEAALRAGRTANSVVTDTTSTATAALSAAKPVLRGWLHLVAFPMASLAGLVLIILAPAGRARISVTIFTLTAALLFGVSALYHRGNWSPRVLAVLRRLDHANIFLIIAGTYTPFTVLLLPGGPARTLLWLVWGGAIAGVLFQVLWVGAPRWLYVPVYVALGWVAVVYLPDFLRGGIAPFTLVVVGGGLYTLGGIVYGLKRPDPSPRWFGFHEVFHAFTLAAFVTHYIGVSLVVYASAG
jgi:hemolysin III